MREKIVLAIAGIALLWARSASPEVLGGTLAGGGSSGALDAWLACAKTRSAAAECRSLRSAAVGLLADDLRSLGAGGNFAPLPMLTRALRSPEPELRAAAADGVGMLGPSPAETAALAAAFNDPVPAVRNSARLALGASRDAAAVALSGRALHAERWQSFEPEREPDLAKLKFPLYAGATPLRFTIDLTSGAAQLSSPDAPEKVVAFYTGKAKRQALSLDEFSTAYSGEAPEDEPAEESGEDSGDDSGDGMPSEADMARAMAMMDAFNEQMDAGKTVEEAAQAMVGAETSADSAATSYADQQIYEAPRFVVLEEIDWNGGKKPVRYVVVYRDLTLGKTGIALRGPPLF